MLEAIIVIILVCLFWRIFLPIGVFIGVSFLMFALGAHPGIALGAGALACVPIFADV